MNASAADRPDLPMSGKITAVIDLVPGRVMPLISVQASDLTPERFRSEFVHQRRPGLIKRAACAWPALSKWRPPGYLESISGNATVEVGRSFNPALAESYVRERRNLAAALEEMRLAADDSTYSIPAFGMPEGWQRDLGTHAFLDAALDRKPLMYPRNRLFVYRNASSEWHYHLFEESLTTQLGGSKRISLFRLTSDNWLPYSELIESGAHHETDGAQRFPEAQALVEHEGVLEAGDSVYIPPFWWHGIDPVDPTLGFTLAHCFRSPSTNLACWTDPIAQRVFKGLLSRRKKLVPLALSLIAYSTLRRKLAGENWYAPHGVSIGK